MRALLAAAAFLASSSSLAKDWMLVTPAGVDLENMTLTSCDAADLCVNSLRIDAPFGIRRARGGDGLNRSAPMLLEEKFRVRDAAGTEFQLVIHAAEGDRVAIEVSPLGTAGDQGGRTAVSGTYKVARVQIAGELTNAHYPDLVLEANGTFHLGSTRGEWRADGETLSLDGHFATWGPAEIGPHKDLTFRFRRGSIDFVIILAENLATVAHRD